MNTAVSRKTNILYIGNEPIRPVERPEVLPIYPSTANIITDMDDYDRANKGKNIITAEQPTPIETVSLRQSAI